MGKEKLSSSTNPLSELMIFASEGEKTSLTETQNEILANILLTLRGIKYDYQTTINDEPETKVEKWLQTTIYNKNVLELALIKNQPSLVKDYKSQISSFETPETNKILITPEEAPKKFKISVLDENPQETQRFILPEIIELFTKKHREENEKISTYLKRISSRLTELENQGMEFQTPLSAISKSPLFVSGRIQVKEKTQEKTIIDRIAVWIDVDFETIKNWLVKE